MANSRAEAEKTQEEPGASCILERKEVHNKQKDWMSRGHQSQLKGLGGAGVG